MFSANLRYVAVPTVPGVQTLLIPLAKKFLEEIVIKTVAKIFEKDTEPLLPTMNPPNHNPQNMSNTSNANLPEHNQLILRSGNGDSASIPLDSKRDHRSRTDARASDPKDPEDQAKSSYGSKNEYRTRKKSIGHDCAYHEANFGTKQVLGSSIILFTHREKTSAGILWCIATLIIGFVLGGVCVVEIWKLSNAVHGSTRMNIGTH
ncbi:hypothetical protein Daesc_003548 [Daldinia eschscholtzii]|uniref:Uncharacterized protein n=1 Tax=Daldinia eschscholtzii TaxID=292717 RepID=A0AAX6MUP5_9PEZI